MSKHKEIDDLVGHLHDTCPEFCPPQDCSDAEEAHHVRQLADECGVSSSGPIQQVAAAVLSEHKRQAARRQALRG